MFDLEDSIQEWRNKLKKHPGLEPGYIDELESHLRDKIAALTAGEMSQQEAFEKARDDQIDDINELATEFFVSRSRGNQKPNWKSHTMFSQLLPNFLKVAYRNFRRTMGYTLINLFGLAVGLASCILIFMYVFNEWSYDRMHEKGDRIYRVVTEAKSPQSDRFRKIPTTGWPVGRFLENNYPEVKNAVTMRSYPTYTVEKEGQKFFESMVHADNDFFAVFSFPLVEGNPDNALANPYSVVISEKMKKKYFGPNPAVGQELTMQDSLSFTVTGVMEEIPDNSHLQFDMVISFATLLAQNPAMSGDTGWFNLNMMNYVLLREGVDTQSLRAKVASLYREEAKQQLDRFGYDVKLNAEPLESIYLRTGFGNPFGPTGNITYVYLLAAIALFILVIACINFINLATARSAERAREVGLRKVAGSNTSTLIGQFMTESLVTTLTAMVLAFVLIALFLPQFNLLTQKEFQLSEFFTIRMAIYYLGFLGIVGLLAGLYPSVVLAGYDPGEVLRSATTSSKGDSFLRKGLVVFQFTISCILIVGTLVVVRQLDHMQGQNLGFDKQQVAVMDIRKAKSGGSINYETVKNQLLDHPGITSVSASYATPGRSGWQGQIAYPEGGSPEDGVSTEYLAVDYGYLPTLEIDLLAGRNFSRQYQTDAEQALLINRTAAESFGWGAPENAIGKNIQSPSGYPAGTVVGVVEDYHHHGLKQTVEPLVMDINPGAYNFFALRFQGDRAESVLSHMRSVWDTFFPAYTFSYFFLDEDFARQYREEQRLAKIFGVFSGLAIVIACLGLFGLAAFAARKRAKEIGIRKVLGASTIDIITMLSRQFLWLVGIALVIAGPIAYLAMNRWLNEFPSRIELGAGIFLMTAAIAIVIALISVGWQSMRAALLDPVKSIRSDQ